MKCSKAQRFISDYIDNLLDISRAEELENHLERCSRCRDLLDDMKSIVHNAKELNTCRTSADLWPEIEAGVLENNRRMNNKITLRGFTDNFMWPSRGIGMAVSAVIILLIAAPLVYLGLPHNREGNKGQEITAMDHFKLAEQHYQSAIEALDNSIEAGKTKLSPELEAVFQRNLRIIDESIRVCKAAVEKHPDNPEANKLLLICYRKKIELLNEIKDISIEMS